MVVLFSTSSPKIPKSGTFGPKFKDFICAANFATRQIWERWYQIWQYFYGKFQPKKTQIRHFWSLIWALSFLRENLELDKLDGVDFKYEHTFSTVQPKDPNRVILVPSLFFVLFWMKLYNFTNSRILIKNFIIAFIKLQHKNT